MPSKIICVRCGYSLVGIQREGACPECGTSVEQTLSGDLLRFSPAEYRRAVRLGLLLVLVSDGVQILNMQFSELADAQQWAVVGMLDALGTFFSLVGFAGWWIASRPDPSHLGLHRADRTRLVLRCLLTVVVPIEFYDMVLSWMMPLPLWIEIPLALVGASVYIVSCLYLAWLAGRVPALRLSRWCGRAAWLFPVLFISFGAALFATVLILWPEGETEAEYLFRIGAGALVCVIYALYLVLVWRVRRAVGRIDTHDVTPPSVPSSTRPPSGSSDAPTAA